MTTPPVSPPWQNRIVAAGERRPGDLLPNPRNWRRHPDAQQRVLAAALGEVGWVAQVIVNRRTGHLVDGHLRVALAMERGESTVPVSYVDLSEDEERLVLATLDPIAAMAEAEADALRDLLAETACEDAELRSLLARLTEANDLRPGLLGDPDEAPPLPDQADVYVRRGQLWHLGEHRLLCGDSTDPADVARLMDGATAECMWTDPPYGVEYEGKTARKLTIDNDGASESDDVILGAFRIAPLAPSARFYVAAPAGRRMLAFLDALVAVGWRLHQELVWSKGTIVLGHSDYHYAHEPILYGYVLGPGRPGRGDHPGTRWYGDHSQSSVLEYPKPAASRDHPTAKPVGLVSQCLRNSTRAGDLVYEPFAGSGTTLIAAEELGRRCHAIELDPRYAQVTLERWQALTGRVAQVADG